jgi:RNA polymerase sigma factor (sigma-70 family)
MKISELKGYENFKRVCNFGLCSNYYPDFVGSEKYIIVSDCDETYLKAEFPEIMAFLSPYVIIGRYFNRFQEEARYIEKKERCHRDFSIDELASCEDLSDSLLTEDFSDEIIFSGELEAALAQITDIQRSRIRRHYFEGMSFSEIAKQDGKSESSVRESIFAALSRLKKIIS